MDHFIIRLRIPQNHFLPAGRSLFYHLHPANDAAFEHDLDAPRMYRRIGQKPLHDPFRQLAGTLILFLHDQDSGSHLYILADCSIHAQIPHFFYKITTDRKSIFS